MKYCQQDSPRAVEPMADDMSVHVGLGTGNKDQAIQHLGLIGNLQKELIALQGGNANGPFVTAENIANATQKVTETLGFKSPGMFFQPPGRVAAAGEAPPEPPQPPQDPGVALALAQIEITKQAAAAIPVTAEGPGGHRAQGGTAGRDRARRSASRRSLRASARLRPPQRSPGRRHERGPRAAGASRPGSAVAGRLFETSSTPRCAGAGEQFDEREARGSLSARVATELKAGLKA
jgi:hypothetical protein